MAGRRAHAGAPRHAALESAAPAPWPGRGWRVGYYYTPATEARSNTKASRPAFHRIRCFLLPQASVLSVCFRVSGRGGALPQRRRLPHRRHRLKTSPRSFKSGRFAPKIRSDRVSDRQVLSEPAQGPAALSRRCATGIARCRRWHSGTGTREDGCRAAGWPRGAACTAAVRASVVRRKYIRTRSQQAQRKTQLYTCDAHVLSIQRRGRDERGWAAHRRCPAAARSSARRRTPWAARRRRA